MLLDKIAILEAEITQLRNLSDDASNDDVDGQQLRDGVARINHIILGDEFTTFPQTKEKACDGYCFLVGFIL